MSVMDLPVNCPPEVVMSPRPSAFSVTSFFAVTVDLISMLPSVWLPVDKVILFASMALSTVMPGEFDSPGLGATCPFAFTTISPEAVTFELIRMLPLVPSVTRVTLVALRF